MTKSSWKETAELVGIIAVVDSTKSVKQWAPRSREIGLTESREGFREYADRVLREAPNSTE